MWIVVRRRLHTYAVPVKIFSNHLGTIFVSFKHVPKANRGPSMCGVDYKYLRRTWKITLLEKKIRKTSGKKLSQWKAKFFKVNDMIQFETWQEKTQINPRNTLKMTKLISITKKRLALIRSWWIPILSLFYFVLMPVVFL